MRARIRPSLVSGAVLLAALVAAGCGSSNSGDYGGSHPNYARALAGSPPLLAALHKQENELLGGGQKAFDRRLKELSGYPVVINVWASWCVPCRQEFPVFQKLATHYGKKVAFLGVNSEDSDDAAATFLREMPVPYPSYTDPDKSIAESLGVNVGFPDTAFYDKFGYLLYLKQGPYTKDSELEADVRRYTAPGA
jgi:cytochrome c biogenesis protein CcmG/thiol:disulfide interchange protein DsbE